jgi:uncharacterized membrane protein YwaF
VSPAPFALFGPGHLAALASGPPDWHFFSFFAIHGSVVASAAVLVPGAGLVPRRGAPWRALLAWFGPWPLYLLVCEIIAAAAFLLLYLPFRER